MVFAGGKRRHSSTPTFRVAPRAVQARTLVAVLPTPQPVPHFGLPWPCTEGLAPPTLAPLAQGSGNASCLPTHEVPINTSSPRANALYEGTYLLGTSIARPLIAKRQIEIAKEVGRGWAAWVWPAKG